MHSRLDYILILNLFATPPPSLAPMLLKEPGMILQLTFSSVNHQNPVVVELGMRQSSWTNSHAPLSNLMKYLYHKKLVLESNAPHDFGRIRIDMRQNSWGEFADAF